MKLHLQFSSEVIDSDIQLIYLWTEQYERLQLNHRVAVGISFIVVINCSHFKDEQLCECAWGQEPLVGESLTWKGQEGEGEGRLLEGHLVLITFL